MSCGWLAGNERINRLCRHRRLLEQLCGLMNELEENFTYRQDTLLQVFTRLSAQRFDLLPLSGPAENFPAWQKVFVSQLAAQGLAGSEELVLLQEFFEQLGTQPASEEITRVKACRAALQRPLAEAEKIEREGKKLYRSLGLCAAAVMTVLLL